MEDIKKLFGLFDVIFFVVGFMIGFGIFIVFFEMLCDLGSVGWLLFIWLLIGVIMFFGVFSYGELVVMFLMVGG